MASFNKGYALVVGIANYPRIRKLPATVLKDAQDVQALLTDADQCGYPSGQVHCLLDEQATADNIRTELCWLAGQAREEDTAIFFFSGHGGRIESGPQAGNYLIPVDTDPAELAQTALTSAELTGLLRDIRAGRLLALFDCCHAGGTGEIKDGLEEGIPDFKPGLDERYYARLATGQGRVIIASARSNELAWVLPEMQNSLFTHYLVQALRGQARTYGDGLIRILDVFNFVAEEVPKHQAQQHPILKAELETNFPIALYRAGRRYGDSPPSSLSLENPGKLPFPDEAGAVLKTMFSDYQRVVIEKAFGGGLSGGQVFLVQPIRRNNIGELPAVVKLASVSLVQKEWQAYQDYIRDRLPNSIGIRDKPILPPGSDWAGLRYPLAGSGKFAIESFYHYCRRASLADLRFSLEERLLKVLEGIIQYHQISPAFYLQASYDHLLPVNLLIKPEPAPEGVQPCSLSPAGLPDSPLKQGDYVRLEGFVVTKVDLPLQTITLNLPPVAGGPPAAYYLRLRGGETPAAYQINQVIEALEGVVIESRAERLQAEVRRSLGPEFDPASPVLALPDGPELPNPLVSLVTLLSAYRHVKVGCIHGDLNMENILVDPATRDVSLIDFAEARQDHILHDFLRLETEIVTKLIPESLAKANLGAAAIYLFYRRLHVATFSTGQPAPVRAPQPDLEKPFAMLVAIRRTARKYLFDPDDWTEYYQGLLLYLVGALKFKNLDRLPEAPAPLPKQVAFWAAATVAGLLEQPPTPDSIIMEERSMQTKQPSTSTGLPANAGSQPAKTAYADLFAPFEVGLTRLQEQMGQAHGRYADFLLYQGRLTENIRRSRRFGNTADRQAERAEIMDQLNELALATVGVSFNELCQA